MIRKSTLTKMLLFLILTTFFVHVKSTAQLTSLNEGFDDLTSNGWVRINHSSNSSTGLVWFQGSKREFSSYAGNPSSYAAANYQSAGTANGTISNWLISPEINISNGGSVTFYTRAENSQYPDRLEVRLSRNAASTNVGSGPNAVGDFTTVLKTINETLDVGGYPTEWTEYTIAVPPGGASGRIAFRYYVTNGGSNGDNSNYIGVDEFSFESVLPVTLLNFNGIIKNNQAYLTWSTANEINNKGFEVQVSRDNKSFSALGFVSAAIKGSAGIHNYNYTDDEILSGTNYYRLKQIDVDGSARYSSVIKLSLSKFAWNILGNPSANNATIQLQTEAQNNISIQIFSLNSQLIQTINKGSLAAGTYNIPINVSNASHGIYVVKLMVDKNSYTKKILY